MILVEALPTIIEYLQAEGYEFWYQDELIYRDNH